MAIGTLLKIRDIGLQIADENELLSVEWRKGFHLAITEQFGECHMEFGDKSAPSVKVTLDPEGAARATFEIKF